MLRSKKKCFWKPSIENFKVPFGRNIYFFPVGIGGNTGPKSEKKSVLINALN